MTVDIKFDLSVKITDIVIACFRIFLFQNHWLTLIHVLKFKTWNVFHKIYENRKCNISFVYMKVSLSISHAQMAEQIRIIFAINVIILILYSKRSRRVTTKDFNFNFLCFNVFHIFLIVTEKCESTLSYYVRVVILFLFLNWNFIIFNQSMLIL